jgi:hypothetical protein
METKQYTFKETKGFHINFNWKPPANLDFSRVNPDKVEYAFNIFFQQHPEVLEQIFHNLDNYSGNQQISPKIPEIAPEKRDAILLSLME